ncbi:hypothetical protein ABH966_003631 [Lysinibacillus sp. RC46]|uniref:hypothetical protein n=1 Tax=Lysinibacillus sp. RC46 TaxID=3156295 RepID=UPI003517E315
MNKNRGMNILWSEALGLFSEKQKMDLTSFLLRLIEIIRNDQEAIEHFLNHSQNNNKINTEDEKLYFQYVMTIEPEMYVIGATGDDFDLIISSYINLPPKSEIEICRRLSNLIKDIITFVSSTVCLQCKSDHLRILSDIEGINLYKYCETCSYTEGDEKVSKSREFLVPANVVMLKKADYLI